MRALLGLFLGVAFLSNTAQGLENGLALTPPMGWRSWNAYHGDIDDQTVRRVVDIVTSFRPAVDGNLSSLLDLGYSHVGVDDGWQACGKVCRFSYRPDS